MIRSLFLTLALLTSFLTSMAQREKAEQSIEWFSLVNNIKINDKLTVLAEGQFRYAGAFQPMQFQARTGLNVKVNEHFSYMPLGYVYSWNPIYGVQPAAYSNNEHRLFEQVQYKHKAGVFHLDYRLRLEQRFLQVHETDNGEVVSKGYTLYMNRLRTRVAAQVPINHKTMEAKTVFASFYDELFIDFGGATINTDPDQNRFFLGGGYNVNKSFALQAGFLYQMLIKMSGLKQENNIGFQVILTHNFDATRKKD
jgi:hypothetical protein